MSPTRKPRAARGGFTLIELLVVIGIIVVLIAMLAAGLRHTRYLATRHETEIELKLCEDMLAEYKAVNGYKYILGPADSVVPSAIRLPDAWIAGLYNTPIYCYPKDNGRFEVTNFINTPASALIFLNLSGSMYNQKGPAAAGSFAETDDPNNPRWASDATRWTQGVMYILLRDPKNRALISNLPPARLLEAPGPMVNSSGQIIGKPGKPYTIDAAVPLDGWHNPILFVPPGGMHIWTDPAHGDDKREYVLRTSGTYWVGKVPPVGGNDHPFFASAGPDGYFTHVVTGDDFTFDNMYSFQQ